MKDREEVKAENQRNYLRKGNKSQGQHSRNQIPQTIERKANNDSAFDREDIEYP